MRHWWATVFLGLIAGCSSDRTSPGIPPDVPTNLISTTLDRAVFLSWDDNSYTADPDIFESYRVHSTTYDLDARVIACSPVGATVYPEPVESLPARLIPLPMLTATGSVGGAS